MIEFTLLNGKPCAICPTKVVAIHESEDGRCYIAFGGDDANDLLVKEPYVDVLTKIRAANTKGS